VQVSTVSFIGIWFSVPAFP